MTVLSTTPRRIERQVAHERGERTALAVSPRLKRRQFLGIHRDPNLPGAHAFRRSCLGTATLKHTVPVVLGRRPAPEVRRVHARRVVAAVTDEVSGWHRAVSHLPCRSVRSRQLASGADPQASVALSVFTPCPRPARIRASGSVYLFVETLFERTYFRHVSTSCTGWGTDPRTPQNVAGRLFSSTFNAIGTLR